VRAIEWIAEQRIREAIEAGKLNNLPGAGKPLRLESDCHLPPELRLAYTVLRNAGFLPPVIELRRKAEQEMEGLEHYLQTCQRYAAQYCAEIRKLAQKVETARDRGKRVSTDEEKLSRMLEAYASFRERCRQAVVERLERVRSCVDELQREWLRESSRKAFAHGVDLSLLAPDPDKVLARVESLFAPLEPEDRRQGDGLQPEDRSQRRT
jgi:hypothetical protein